MCGCTFGHFHPPISSQTGPVHLSHRWGHTSQPGKEAPGSCGWVLVAVGDAAGAGLDHHHLLLGDPALGAAENHPHRPGVGGAAAASLWTAQVTKHGAEGSGAPAALVFKLNRQR